MRNDMSNYEEFDQGYINDMLLNPDLYGIEYDEEEQGCEEETADDEEQ